MARVIRPIDGDDDSPADKPKRPSAKKVEQVSDADSPSAQDAAEPSTDAADDLTLDELNESLKSLSPDMGETPIEKIEDDDEIKLDGPEVAIDNQELDDMLADEEDATDPSVDEPAEPEAPEQSEPLIETSPDEPPEESEPVESENEELETKTEKPEALSDEDGLPDDPETRKAVDEIVAEEADVVLAAEDMEREIDADIEQPKPRNIFMRVLGSTRGRWIMLVLLTLGLIAAGLVPTSRYFVLNTAGVRASLSLRVVDAGTLQPLKNVTVRAGGASGLTDGNGTVVLQGARLGRTNLQIEKRAFSSYDRPVTLGWGSNPLGEFEARAVGSQYTFEVKDFLSGKPIAGAEATSGDGNAKADEEGKLVLTLDTANLEDSEQIVVLISAGNYRTETITLSVSNKEAQSVEMVPSRKHVFVSKRSGKYDVYTVDVDGKNERKVVEGSGLERDDITLVPHPSENKAALVSTRERVQNSEGYLLSTVYVVDFDSGDLVKIDQSEQIQIIGWSGDSRLLYVKIAAGTSAADAKRHRLMSYNSRNFADIKELASANSVNDVLMAGNRVYYAPSNIFNENPNPGLFAVNPDGGNLQTVLNKEVYNIFRTSYDTLDISIGANWYTYTLGSATAATASQPPVTQYSRAYADAPNGESSLWVDTRDGKGVLLRYDKSAKADSSLVNRSGLKVPVYWLTGSHVVFRLNDGTETADFIVNVEGGDARKITDVTDTNGVDRWFYY